MTQLKIKILGKTRQRKGRTFERFMKIILDHMDYTDFRPNPRYTGMEIDIKAKHKVKDESLICECKAHDEAIGPQDLTDFFGKVGIRGSQNPSLRGLFVSVSGFTGTFLETYDEYLSPADKERVKLLDNSGIVSAIKGAGLILNDQELDSRIKSLTPFRLGERYIIYSDLGLFVVQVLLVGGKASHYIILTGLGELADKTIEEEILRQDKELQTLKRIDLRILEKVTHNLLDMRDKTIDQISDEITETRSDTRIAINELVLGDTVLESKETVGSFQINPSIDNLGKLLKKFSSYKKEYEFMSSTFVDVMIDDNFINYVANRFRLDLNPEQRTSLMTISRISPSALWMELLDNPEPYENSHRQIRQSAVSELEKDKLHKNTVKIFLGEILIRTLDDIRSNAPAEYLDKKAIRGYHLRNTLRIATDSGLIFDQEYRSSQYLAIKGGPIKVGELVSGGAPAIFKMGVTLKDLKEYEDAIQYFQQSIDNTIDPNILKQCWNNKGACLIELKRCEEAVPCFAKTLSYDPDHVEARANMAKCLESLGRSE
jgi:tetratricopeptide (TPR) repeat protein